MTFVAWIYETSPVEGWTCFVVEAATHAEAVENASRQCLGTRGAWTLEVEEAR